MATSTVLSSNARHTLGGKLRATWEGPDAQPRRWEAKAPWLFVPSVGVPGGCLGARDPMRLPPRYAPRPLPLRLTCREMTHPLSPCSILELVGLSGHRSPSGSGSSASAFLLASRSTSLRRLKRQGTPTAGEGGAHKAGRTVLSA
jgi:hypothetical protein